eukprot:Pgem_evm1s16362
MFPRTSVKKYDLKHQLTSATLTFRKENPEIIGVSKNFNRDLFHDSELDKHIDHQKVVILYLLDGAFPITKEQEEEMLIQGERLYNSIDFENNKVYKNALTTNVEDQNIDSLIELYNR